MEVKKVYLALDLLFQADTLNKDQFPHVFDTENSRNRLKREPLSALMCMKIYTKMPLSRRNSNSKAMIKMKHLLLHHILSTKINTTKC